jgi:hypothetical protein
MDTQTITFAIVFLIIIIAVIVFLIYISAKRAKFRREAAYALSANAVVIGKRAQISGHDNTFTNYFVTFDIEGIGRAEFNVAGSFSGLLVEGDRGIIRYLLNPLRIVDFTPASQFQQFQQIHQ